MLLVWFGLFDLFNEKFVCLHSRVLITMSVFFFSLVPSLRLRFVIYELLDFRINFNWSFCKIIAFTCAHLWISDGGIWIIWSKSTALSLSMKCCRRANQILSSGMFNKMSYNFLWKTLTFDSLWLPLEINLNFFFAYLNRG